MNIITKRILAGILAAVVVIGTAAATTVILNKNEDFDKNTAVTVKDGLSAYEIAVAEGYSGSVQEWIESLNGNRLMKLRKSRAIPGQSRNTR